MKNLILLIGLCSVVTAQAQYANSGNGLLKNELYWFNWAGFTIADNATRTFVTADGLTVTITFKNVSPTVPAPNVMNTWRGAVLHFLYDFTNPAIQPAFYSNLINTNHQFTLHITATRDGSPAPFNFVAADAEASTSQEIITLNTSGTPWQTMEFFENNPNTYNNPLKNCGTTTVSISETYGGTSGVGQNPLVVTEAPVTGILDVTVDMIRSGVNGGEGVAFALFAPIDRGDLSASYGQVAHQLKYIHNNPCNYLAPFPATTLQTNLSIGAMAGDADPVQGTDDNTNGADEDGVVAFPAYTGSGSYTLPVNITNTTGTTAYLTGWFDYNHDGQFVTSEAVTLPVTGSFTPSLTWTGLPAALPATTGHAFRFRLTTDPTAGQSPNGYAPDGEVEDYWVPCTLKINTSNDTTVCSGNPVPIVTTGGAAYHWNTTTGLSDATIGNPVANPMVTTKYYVESNDHAGCYSKDSIEITINTSPVLAKSADTTICKTGTASFSISGAQTYVWSAGVTLVNAAGSQATASPAATTKYYVTATGANGCKRPDSIEVRVKALPVFGVKPATALICDGHPVTLTASGGDQYAWVLNNTVWSGNASVSVQPVTNTIYKVGITDNTCRITDTLLVPVQLSAAPVTSVTASGSITCSNNEVQLHVASDGSDDTYAWDPLPGMATDSLTTANPIVQPTQATRYYVTITNNDGCPKRDSVDVKVDQSISPGSYSVVNAFSPNGDGRNDCFGLKFWGAVKQLDLSVYNRWGGRVFYTTRAGDCWNGTFKGKDQPAGAFVYVIKAVTACGTVSRKGIVHLVR